ncbi:hypothetical protein J3Q64DRAFT_1873881 [Phycomyces blakesleeanus]|uniref:Mitochondrial cardiolipin hydrolase n=1 Tax=Phycomyces blakesleeanus TaxID=4837 RepID=A0ABR3AKY4_PHYBL
MGSVNNIVSDNDLLEKVSSHLNYLLNRQSGRPDEAVAIMNKMFSTAERALETDTDRQIVSLLKTYVSCFIGSTLGVRNFLPRKKSEDEEEEADENRHKDERHISWTEVANHHAKISEYSEDRDIHAPELAEHARLVQLAEEYNTLEDDNGEYEEGEEGEEYEEESDEDPEKPKSREINGDFQTVRRKRPQLANGGGYNNRSRVRPKYFEPHHLERLSPEAYCIPIFFPSENSYQAFISALGSAKKSLLVCVFSLTDNNTADILIDAKERGVDVRIITDNDQLEGKGADVRRLHEDYGIPYKTDNSDQFMHNKFAVIDGRVVITGSFNWSIGARFKNRENVVITNIPSVVEPFQVEFERLWDFF